MKAHWWTFGLLLIGESAVAIVPPAAWDVEQAPANIPTDARIAPSGEPGAPLLITGTVYAADGVTPVAGAVVYAYHTDIHGLYRAVRRFDAPPRLCGWARTDATGHYSFQTI